MNSFVYFLSKIIESTRDWVSRPCLPTKVEDFEHPIDTPRVNKRIGRNFGFRRR